MTELEQYRKAYTTLAGRVDAVATKLMNESAKMSPKGQKNLMLIALELLFTLYEVENSFPVENGPDDK